MKTDGLSWNELHAYTNAKVVLRRVNGLLAKSREGESGREELLRKTGELTIDFMDAMAGENADYEHFSYTSLLNRGNELVDEIINAGLIQTGKEPEKPDWELLKTVNCIRALGGRLSEFKLVDIDDDRRLPDEFVRLEAASRTYDGFKEAARERPHEWDRRVGAGEFAAAYGHSLNAVAGDETSLKRKLLAVNRTDLIDDAAHKAACALMHVNAGLCHETAGDKKEMYLRCAKLITGTEKAAGMYETLVSDDPFHSSRRLFEAEKEAFLAGKSSPVENISWELDSILGKLGAYGRLAAEARSFVRDIARKELIEGNGECEPDGHLAGCIRKINDIGREMNASAAILFHNHYGPSRRVYDALDAAKSGQCATTGDVATDKIAELLTLCYACDATMQLSGGKTTGGARFDAIYGDMLQMMKVELRKAGGTLEEIVSRYVAENGGGRES